MLLDQPDQFPVIDPQHMLGHIDALPDQLANAWAHAQQQDVPADFAQARRSTATHAESGISRGDVATTPGESVPAPAPAAFPRDRRSTPIRP